MTFPSRKIVFELVLFSLCSVACLGRFEKEDAMVKYLSISNYTQGKAEVVFLLDRSGSVGAADFEVEKGFVESFLTHVVVDENATRVAVISYSDEAVRHIDYLREPKNKCFLAQELKNVVYENSAATNIAAAFDEARLVLKNARPNVNKVIVLISDGLATKGADPIKNAEKLKANGIEIFCFGVGRFLQTELETLASSQKHVYTCEGFSEFKRLARKIRGDPHESLYSSQGAKPKCDHLCNSPYKGESYDPGCCDPDALCSCALRSGMHSCVCKPGYYGLSGLAGDCTACPRGTYKSKLEPSSSCTLCPPGSTTADIASKKQSDCHCKEGFVGDPSNYIPCKRINCPPLQKPARGFLLGNCNTAYGSSCIFMCDEGFEFVDPSNNERHCKSDGKWTGSTTVCQQIRCDHPQKPINGFVICDAEPLTVGKRCEFICMRGYLKQGSTERECTENKTWTGTETQCLTLECEVPPSLANGFTTCRTDKKPEYYQSCAYYCNYGFKIIGSNYLTCNERGKLMNVSFHENFEKPECIDETPPELRCPHPDPVPTEKGKNFAFVQWKIPQPIDNSGYPPELYTIPPGIRPGRQFFIGNYSFKYIAIDKTGHNTSCDVQIEVIDNEPPVVLKCPSTQEVSTNDVDAPVSWEEPEFQDNSNLQLSIYESSKSGSRFQQGSHRVTYIARDSRKNAVACEFKVIVSRTSCPYYPPPINGAFACNDLIHGQMCQAYCNEHYDFIFKPAEWYMCDIDANWITIPEHEPVPWPDCARPALPGEVRQMVGFYYSGDCNDPQVQMHIKKLFLNNYNTHIKGTSMCSQGTCSIKNISVKCGKIVHKNRWKRDVWKLAEKEQLELEFDITIDADQELNNTEEMMQDFLETIRNLKWDLDEEITVATTFSPSQTLLPENRSDEPEELIVSDETTTVVCRPGSVLFNDICVICPAGTYYNSSLQTCIDCSLGYYQENEKQFECYKCPEGTSTEYPRTRIKTSCKGVCAPGTYSTSGLETCISCPVGTYLDEVGKDSCYSCPNGTTTENVGAMSMEDCQDVCAAGSFSQNGLQPCEPCPFHYYQPLIGQMDCLECPKNLSTRVTGSTEAKDCVDIDYCFGDLCLHGGKCRREGREAVCHCTTGFEGSRCEKDIDECQNDPCSNGSVCINTEGSFHCLCRDGFFGRLCDEEINECASLPCQNNGTCLDRINGYVCVCPKGYEGTNCEIVMELCFRDVVCLNDGICTFGESDNSSFCDCRPGFSGVDCSYNINDCENATCKNNGSCVDGINSYACACLLGYTGAHCEVDIDECLNNVCHIGSKCQDLVGSYKCLCPPGWNGTYCENKMNSDFFLSFPESTATIANMATMTLNSPLSEATVSLWVQTNDTDRSGTPLSYAVASTSTTYGNTSVMDNALTISDCSEVKVYVNNEPVVTDLQIADGEWHHLAFTWSSEDSGKWALYKDGQLKYQGKKLGPNDIIHEGGQLVIGQEQDTVGGGFSPIETFTGNITRVNIWNSYFSKTNVTRLCNLDDELPDRVLAWPDFLQGLRGDVQILGDSRPSFK